MDSADWASVASLATAVGTLVLAVATFAWLISANRHWNIDRPDPRGDADAQ